MTRKKSRSKSRNKEQSIPIDSENDIIKPEIDEYLQLLMDSSLKRTRTLFQYDIAMPIEDPEESTRIKLKTKIRDEYSHTTILPPSLEPAIQQQQQQVEMDVVEQSKVGFELDRLIEDASSSFVGTITTANSSKALVPTGKKEMVVSTTASTTTTPSIHGGLPIPESSQQALIAFNRQQQQQSRPSVIDAPTTAALVKSQIHRTPKPEWHAPWKLMRVISGHLGWVRSVAVDVSNEWFATGSADKLVKIWDLASGTLKLSLTGHIGTIRGLAVSPRHPYLFSAGEDKQIKCWDLEVNKVVRHYHGHFSGVYSLALHPTLDVLISGGRDCVAKVWDMRTRHCAHTLTGHNHTVSSLFAQDVDPQIVTGSMDNTIRLWDLTAGKTLTTLTHHKKSIRALVNHPREFTFSSASADNIKQWKFPEGQFIQNLSGHKAIINTLALNDDNVLFSGGDDGSMKFWDWKSGYNYQTMETVVQPGSLDGEAGVFCSTFDKTGLRLLTGEADKTIKIWKQDETATPESHPINWKPSIKRDHY